MNIQESFNYGVEMEVRKIIKSFLSFTTDTIGRILNK